MAKFEHLRIWQESHQLMLGCHRISNELPFSERSRADQLKRSSSAPPDNIAECVGCYYYNDKIKALSVARKESTETQNHLIAIRDKGFANAELIDEFLKRYDQLIVSINTYKKKIIESRNRFQEKEK